MKHAATYPPDKFASKSWITLPPAEPGFPIPFSPFSLCYSSRQPLLCPGLVVRYRTVSPVFQVGQFRTESPRQAGLSRAQLGWPASSKSLARALLLAERVK